MSLEERLRTTFSNEDLDAKVEEYSKRFHGLLTREAALKLIAKDLGLDKQEVTQATLATLEPGAQNLKLTVTITRIGPIQTTAKGLPFRVIGITDGTANSELVLWGKDCAAYQSLRVNDIISLEHAYERLGRINISYKGGITVSKKSAMSPLSLVQEGTYHVEGTVARILESHPGTVTFVLQDASGEKVAQISGDPERARRIGVQKDLVLENVHCDGKLLHIHENSRLFVRRTDGIAGTITRLDVMGESLTVTLDEKQVALNRSEALAAFGIEVREDISLATVVELIKDSKIGTPMFIKTPKC